MWHKYNIITFNFAGADHLELCRLKLITRKHFHFHNFFNHFVNCVVNFLDFSREIFTILHTVRYVCVRRVLFSVFFLFSSGFSTLLYFVSGYSANFLPGFLDRNAYWQAYTSRNFTALYHVYFAAINLLRTQAIIYFSLGELNFSSVVEM